MLALAVSTNAIPAQIQPSLAAVFAMEVSLSIN
jgi:hypothetical protein